MPTPITCPIADLPTGDLMLRSDMTLTDDVGRTIGILPPGEYVVTETTIFADDGKNAALLRLH